MLSFVVIFSVFSTLDSIVSAFTLDVETIFVAAIVAKVAVATVTSFTLFFILIFLQNTNYYFSIKLLSYNKNKKST